MRRSTRILILLAVIEAFLLAGTAYMAMQVASGGWNAPDPQLALSRIFSIMGAAIPIVAVILLILALSLRRKGD